MRTKMFDNCTTDVFYDVIAVLEILNWKLSDLYVSPVAKNHNVTASLSGAVITLLPPKICWDVMSASMYLEKSNEQTS